MITKNLTAEEKKELLRAMLAKKIEEKSYPLSCAQQRLWVVDKLETNKTVNNIASKTLIRGALDVSCLEQSIQSIVNRHEILRSVFILSEGKPVQKIDSAYRFTLDYQSLASCTPLEKEEQIQSTIEKTALRHFDLAKAPSLYAVLVKIKDDEHLLLITLHHMLADGWSMNILLKEILANYSCYVAGTQPEHEPLPIQYGDYAAWQKERLAGNALQAQLDYWKTKLISVKDDLIDLPFDAKRPPVQVYTGKRLPITLDPELSQFIRAACSENQVTLFMYLMAGYYILLQRYSRKESISIGTPNANRSQKETRNLIGCFMDNLVMNTIIDDKSTIESFLQTVKQTAVEAYKNQDIPFTALIDALKPARDLSANPLFQVMFILQNAPMKSVALPGLKFIPEQIDTHTAKFDLTLELFEADDGRIDGWFEYNTSVFAEKTIQRMIGHYSAIVKAMAADGSKSIADIDMLSPEEKTALIETYNHTACRLPEQASVYTLFDATARQIPQKIAVLCDGNSLSYHELRLGSDRLAAYLQDKGVTRGDRVAVCLERSVHLPLVLLAVLKAGASYIPVDPAFPQKRIEYMFADSQAKLLITQDALKDRLPETPIPFISLDGFNKHNSTAEIPFPSPSLSANDVAYTIYTSGSTGNPKGVQIEHRSLTNFLLSMAKKPGFTQHDVLLAVTTLSFDIAGLEMFLPLIQGGQLVIATREQALTGQLLIKLLEQERVTMLQATPATWKMLFASGWKGKQDLKALCGGEALPKELAQKLGDSVFELWNMYGPTETTIWSSIKKISKNDPFISIGQPIDNTEFYIVDKNGLPVPQGVPGELLIGGLGLARGYLNREELTSEKFIAHPFLAGKRVYRTGDLARWMEGGEIDFIGRMDNQVKIRGFRIELSEIESVLKEHESIIDVCVHDYEVNPGDRQLVAYLVVQNNGSHDEYRNFARKRLPDYMVPAFFEILEALPLTPNGKVNKKALPAPAVTRKQAPAAQLMPSSEIEKKIAEIWKEVLERDAIGVHENFFDIGGHSVNLATLYSKMVEAIPTEIKMLDLFTHTTIDAQAKAILSLRRGPISAAHEMVPSKEPLAQGVQDIAIVGLSCRFPGAPDHRSFWELLKNGIEGTSVFTDEILLGSGINPQLLDDPGYVKAWGVCNDVDKFDPHFFAYNPREAEIIDPQQRVFLEECYKALETAGCNPETFKGNISIFAGIGMNTYSNASYAPDTLALNYQHMISNDKDFLASRIAYKLNLKGPAVTVQTACSTSLVAINLACKNLYSGESDAALAGGVSIRLPQETGYVYQEGMILSPDGKCRAFDEKAKGIIGGNGAGVVVLKRLKDAIRDNDTVYAVIKGSAINNDGSEKIGYTAPSVEGQAKAVSQALMAGGIDPATISYIEAHGTGTPLGDPIEIEALSKVFGSAKSTGKSCAIGSVKTNIGHLDTAAGIAGLIKTTLSLYHKQIPPSLHFEKPNPKIPFENSPFYVNTALQDWKQPNGTPLRAGVSSFGIGGTNAHVVLEEAPARTAHGREDDQNAPFELLTFSARSKEALERISADYVDFIAGRKGGSLTDIAFTLAAGRRSFEYKKVIVAESLENTLALLKGASPGNGSFTASAHHEGAEKQPVFLFTGQGSQYRDMAMRLYATQPVFKREFDSCNSMAAAYIDTDCISVLADEAKLNQTKYAQLALFIVEYCMAMLLKSLGIVPAAMIGHSLGEYVAACVAGVFSIEDGIKLVARRAALMNGAQPGAMLAVFMDEPRTRAYVKDSVCIAAVNSPGVTVVSGTFESISALKDRLAAEGIAFRDIKTSHAFHSVMMEPILEDFKALFAEITLHEPKLPYISNYTGTWIKAEEATSSDYWAKHLRGTVRFAKGVSELLKQDNLIFLELGPGTTLSGLVKQQLAKEQNIPVIASLPHAGDTVPADAFFLQALGNLVLQGAKVGLEALYAQRTVQKVALPVYPFERTRLWKPSQGSAINNEQERRQLRQTIPNWYYQAAWKKSYRKPDVDTEQFAGKAVLIFVDGAEKSGAITAERCSALGARVTTVWAGDAYAKHGPASYCMNPAQDSDYQRLFADLKEADALPDYLFHFWNIGSEESEQFIAGGDRTDKILDRSFYSLVNIAKNAGMHAGNAKKIEMVIAAKRLFQVVGSERTEPAKRSLQGPGTVINQEYPALSCRLCDIGEADFTAHSAQMLLAEFKAPDDERFTAYRGKTRYCCAYEKVTLPQEKPLSELFQKGSTILITGGLGGIGMATARQFAGAVQPSLILTSTKPFPQRSEWDAILSSKSDKKTAARIQAILELERLGAQCEVLSCDVTQELELERAARHVKEKYGSIDAVFHAAGVPGGGAIQLKERAAADRVLGPKIKGTEYLYKHFLPLSPRYFVLFSSVTALMGGFGQADYAAANAYLDAFALEHHADGACKVMAINWDTWKEVGMAFEAIREDEGESLVTKHPLIAEYHKDDDRSYRYVSHLSYANWELQEHWIMGKPTLPGTSYLEIVYTALRETVGNDQAFIEIEDVYFMAPLSVSKEEKLTAFTLIHEKDDGYEFSVVSQAGGLSGSKYLEHVKGKARIHAGVTLEKENVPELMASCDKEIIDNPQEKAHLGKIVTSEANNLAEDIVVFGPRWNNMSSIRLGESNGLALLELPEPYKSDTAEYAIHPALLDCAVAFLRIFRYEGIYLPLSYSSIKIFGRIPPKVYSYVELAEEAKSEKGVINFNVKLIDEDGNLIIEIKKFTLREIDQASLAASAKYGTKSLRIGSKGRGRKVSDLQLRLTEEGIKTAEGMAVLTTVLQHDLPQVIVSTVDIGHRFDLYKEKPESGKGESGKNENRELQARPDLKTEYVAPKNEVEKKIEAIWEKLLGIEKIGIHDDIFELGGHSLLLVELHNELRSLSQKEGYPGEISVVDLYKHTTIAALAKFLAGEEDAGSVQLEKVEKRIALKKEALKNRRMRRGGS